MYVQFEANENQYQSISICDINGRVLISQSCVQNCEIDTHTLTNGIYFVNLFIDEKLVSTKKLVIIK
ncbi:MAG: T9SS type A sorting domain-containing protein [Bacteroidetes bacterium]|nr:T9SS type A sorting domain-containing protein [Bacteroidota bacterium]